MSAPTFRLASTVAEFDQHHGADNILLFEKEKVNVVRTLCMASVHHPEQIRFFLADLLHFRVKIAENPIIFEMDFIFCCTNNSSSKNIYAYIYIYTKYLVVMK